MRTVGIIAEYNPFHNGHAYQIAEIRKRLKADYVIIAMSGDFVQRGTPAAIDKYVRTAMALNCGADLVIELPAFWAVSSAESFAMAGVSLFEKMRCVDTLCFGAECDDLELLDSIADVLVTEPDYYKERLSSYLKEGISFPAARSKAVIDYSNCRKADTSDVNAAAGLLHITDSKLLEAIMNAPNNILALEYLKALKLCKSDIQPYLIARKGSGYHAKNIDHPLASATAIRGALKKCSALQKQHPLSDSDENSDALIASAMPEKAYQLLTKYLADYPMMSANDFSSALSYLLLTKNVEELADYADANIDIARRIKKNLPQFSSFEEFCLLNKSRDITYTRMCRLFTHILLNHTQKEYNLAKEQDYIPYLRILGFRKDAAPLLSTVKEHSLIPMITKLADAKNILSESIMALLEKDIAAAELYESVLAQKAGRDARSEFGRGVVRV